MQTVYKLKLNDDKMVNLTLNFASLYKLRAKNRKVYDKYIDVKNASAKKSKEFDDFDSLYILYTAYLCANQQSNMSFEKFIELVPPDNAIVGELLIDLLSPSKKKELFQNPSKKQR